MLHGTFNWLICCDMCDVMSSNNAAAYSSDAANTGASGSASSACHGFIGCNHQCSPQIFKKRKKRSSSTIWGTSSSWWMIFPAVLSCGPLCWCCRWRGDRHPWVIAAIKVHSTRACDGVRFMSTINYQWWWSSSHSSRFFFLINHLITQMTSGKCEIERLNDVYFLYDYYLLALICTEVQFVPSLSLPCVHAAEPEFFFLPPSTGRLKEP